MVGEALVCFDALLKCNASDHLGWHSKDDYVQTRRACQEWSVTFVFSTISLLEVLYMRSIGEEMITQINSLICFSAITVAD